MLYRAAGVLGARAVQSPLNSALFLLTGLARPGVMTQP
jgi:hypothetical protein